MAYLTTTHNHDYRWPDTSCMVPRAEAPDTRCAVWPIGEKADKPWCGRNALPSASHTEPLVCKDLIPTQVDRPWCQRGPLVPRVNPTAITTSPRLRLRPEGCNLEKPSIPERPWCEGRNAEPSIVSARVGVAPQQDTSRYDQPNQYLRKLCDKYPQSSAVVTATPRDELVRRVYADSYRTTYQTDFCTNADDMARRMGEYANTVKNCEAFRIQEGLSDIGKKQLQYIDCKCGCTCRVLQNIMPQHAGDGPRIRPIACRPAAVSNNVHFSSCSRRKAVRRGEEVGPPEKIPPWASEYTEGIGRTGQLIIDQKLLYPKKKVKKLT